MFDNDEEDLSPDEEAEQVTRRLQQYKDDLLYVVSTAGGRRFVASVLEHAGMWSSSISDDHETTEFHEGRRQVALMIYEDLARHLPDHLILMLREKYNGHPGNV